MHLHQWTWSKFTTAVLVGAWVVFMAATARAQSVNEAPIGQPQALSATEVSAYWTEERMKGALPMEMPAPALGRGGNQPPRPDADKGPGVIAGAGAPGDAPWEKTLDPTAAEIEPLFGTYPFSYTRYRLFPNTLTMYQTFPYATIGKLFFTIPGQGNFVCSASSVNSANRSVVWTAGHCVYSPGTGWHTNFVFVPARWQGTNPYGAWTAKQAWTLNGWISGFLEYDMGALVMNLGGNTNTTVGQAVGWLGFTANVSRQQHWHLHGYPAAARDLASTPPGAQFDGEHHELCAAAWATNDLGTNGPQTIGVGCDKTGGTSGGPWTVDFSGYGGATNLLNGNNSYRYLGTAPNNLRLYGPYFGSGAVSLRDAAQAVPVP